MRVTVTTAVLLAAALISVCAAYELLTSPPRVAARSAAGEGRRFLWRPHHAVHLGAEATTVKVSQGPTHCTETAASNRPIGLSGAELARHTKECPIAVLATVDGGSTWALTAKPSPYFCGSLGVVRDGKLHCPAKRIEKVPKALYNSIAESISTADAADAKQNKKVPSRPLISRPVVAFEEVAFDVDEKAALRETATSNTVSFDQSVFSSPIEEVRFGAAVLPIADRNMYLRNALVSLDNGTSVHVCYRSTDGLLWQYVSTIPLNFTRHCTMLRNSETRVQMVCGEIGAMNQSVSLFLGNKWERVDKTPYVMPSASYVGKFGSLVAAGVVPRPMLGLVAVGTKKNSQQTVLLTALHNNGTVASDAESQPGAPALRNFSSGFMTATQYDCVGKDAANTVEAGCESTGFVAIAPADTNSSILVFYDQLSNGHRAYASDEHSIYVVKLLLNETEESLEHDARLLREQKAKEQEKVEQEAATKRREEMRIKKEKEKLDQKRKNKERRGQWKGLDKVFKKRAREHEKVDGEFVVVRPVLEEWVDLEREMF